MGFYLSCSGTVNHISPYEYKGDKAFKATIYRDNMGVPHIFGDTDADAVFGMLYAQSEDDFNRVERNYIWATGRLAEVEGEQVEREGTRRGKLGRRRERRGKKKNIQLIILRFDFWWQTIT